MRWMVAALLAASAASGATFEFGTGKRDITPPPGFPTGGHGPAGSLARGYWTRLWTRAFFVGVKGERGGVVMVSSDLFASPLGLHAAVWKKVKAEASARGLGAESLILAATHTHQGPGNFLSAQVYNEFGSSDAGFSSELFDFLARQIAQAVKEALGSAKEAELRWASREVTPEFGDQFVINRSPAVFLLNYDRDGILKKLNPEAGRSAEACEAWVRGHDPRVGHPELPSDGWDLPGCPRLRAVDRRMTVVEAQRDGARVGALVFFAAHPTDLVHTAPFYSSDFTGMAMDRLEARWRGATVGFFNGAEGDITALRETRDALEVRRLAERFEGEVVATAEGAAAVRDASVQARGRVYDAWDDRKCGAAELAKTPRFGAAALGGAEGDRTLLYGLGWREGVRDRAVDGQGPKLPALDSQLLRDLQLTRVAAPRGHFPRYLPVTMARVGPLAFGALPVEASTALGQRLRERFGENFRVIGLANEYSSYNATESEYLAQDYMGASTIWGPGEGDWFECRLAEVDGKAAEFRAPGGAMAPGPPPHKPGWLWLAQLGIATQRYGAGFVGDRRGAPDEELEKVLVTQSGAPERHLPYFEWTETVSGKEFEAVARQRVVVEAEDGRVVEEAGEFLKMLVGAPDGRGTRLWAAIWVGPLRGAWPGRRRFRVTGADGVERRSVWFAVELGSNARPRAVAAER